MKSALSKREINRQRWLEHVQAWRHSGLEQKAYCEQHRLGFASFQRWLGIVRAEDKARSKSPVTFVPVKVNPCVSPALTLHLSKDLRLEIPTDFDPVLLKQVVQVLQSA